jgi:hypothetical protein
MCSSFVLTDKERANRTTKNWNETMDDNMLTNKETPDPPESTRGYAIMPLQLDPEEYRECLKDFDLTEAQQNELLEVLWNIMRTFVEIGFGLDSVQMFSTTETDCPADKAGPDSGNVPGRKNTPQRFNRAAEKNGNKEA